MTRSRVFIPDPIHADGVERLSRDFVVDTPAKDAPARQRGFAAADAAIIRNLPVDASVLAGAARLKVIAKHGAGYDNIDVAAATAQGIVVANVPGGNAEAVAEATVALMLARFAASPRCTAWSPAAATRRASACSSASSPDARSASSASAISAPGSRESVPVVRMRVLAYDPELSAAAVAERGAEKVDELAALLVAADSCRCICR